MRVNSEPLMCSLSIGGMKEARLAELDMIAPGVLTTEVVIAARLVQLRHNWWYFVERVSPFEGQLVLQATVNSGGRK